jgi:hypothetical protein
MIKTCAGCRNSSHCTACDRLKTPDSLFKCCKLSLKFDDFRVVDIESDHFRPRSPDPTASCRLGDPAWASQISSSRCANDGFEAVVVLLLSSRCSNHHLMITVLAARLQSRARELTLKVPNVVAGSTATSQLDNATQEQCPNCRQRVSRVFWR